MSEQTRDTSTFSLSVLLSRIEDDALRALTAANHDARITLSTNEALYLCREIRRMTPGMVRQDEAPLLPAADPRRAYEETPAVRAARDLESQILERTGGKR